MQAPCKDCPDRHTLCHSTCKKYIEYNNYREWIRRKRREIHDRENDYYESLRRGRRK